MRELSGGLPTPTRTSAFHFLAETQVTAFQDDQSIALPSLLPAYSEGTKEHPPKIDFSLERLATARARRIPKVRWSGIPCKFVGKDSLTEALAVVVVSTAPFRPQTRDTL